jgi:hypothetical protein
MESMSQVRTKVTQRKSPRRQTAPAMPTAGGKQQQQQTLDFHFAAPKLDPQQLAQVQTQTQVMQTDEYAEDYRSGLFVTVSSEDAMTLVQPGEDADADAERVDMLDWTLMAKRGRLAQQVSHLPGFQKASAIASSAPVHANSVSERESESE